jgi:hypothetical protein
MGVSLYTQEQRKDFAEKAKALLVQSDNLYDIDFRNYLVEKAKAYIALAQL